MLAFEAFPENYTHLFIFMEERSEAPATTITFAAPKGDGVNGIEGYLVEHLDMLEEVRHTLVYLFRSQIGSIEVLKLPHQRVITLEQNRHGIDYLHCLLILQTNLLFLQVPRLLQIRVNNQLLLLFKLAPLIFKPLLLAPQSLLLVSHLSAHRLSPGSPILNLKCAHSFGDHKALGRIHIIRIHILL